MFSVMPQPLYLKEKTWVPILQSTWPAPELIWTLGKAKNLFPLKGFELRTIWPLFWSRNKYAILAQSSSGKFECCSLFFNLWLIPF
jgi:hypothetical protein